MTLSTLLRAGLRVVLLSLSFIGATVAASEAASTQLRVTDAWARATAPGAGVAAVYLLVHGGTRADRLVRVSTARAAMAQVHSVTTDGGVSRMREMTDGVVIPARSTVAFAPQGLHIMLMGLESPLVPGERFVVTLEFETTGKLEAEVVVQSATATGKAPR